MILIGTDFSQAAALAAAEARVLAAGMDATLTFLHVRIGDGRAAPWGPDEVETKWLAKMRLELSDLEVRFGIPWIELIRTAEELHASIIVVGTHGNTGFQPVALGSTAARLALLSPVPTLLVGGRERGRAQVLGFFEEPASSDENGSHTKGRPAGRPSIIRPGEGSDA